MAISATSYSPKDFQLAFVPETTIGTASNIKCNFN